MGKVFPLCRGVIVEVMCSIQGVSIVKGLWTAACGSISIFAGAVEYEKFIPLNASHRGLELDPVSLTHTHSL